MPVNLACIEDEAGVGLECMVRSGPEGETVLRPYMAASLPKLGDALGRLAKQLASSRAAPQPRMN